MEVEIPATEVEREYSRIARDLQRRARVPGFRPGKAPLSLVRQRYEANIREQVLETMVPAYLRTAFERESLEPVSRPAIEELHFHSGEPIRFKASFEVLPDFELGDYRSLKITPEAASTRSVEEDLKLALEHLRQESAVYDDATETLAADGLTVVAEYSRQAEGETETQHAADSQIEIGGENTLAEFSEALRGAAIGEVREFDVHYPEDFGHPSVAGKRLHFKLTIKGLKRKRLPEIDETFARQHQAESVAALEGRLREGIEANRKNQAQDHAQQQLIEQLLQMHQFPVPEALVEDRIKSRLEREFRSLAAQGIDPRQLNLDWSKLRARQHERATEDVKLSLILDRIAGAEHIEVSPDEVRREVAELAQRLHQPVETLERRLAENGAQDQIKARLRNEKTLQQLLAQAGFDPSAEPAAPAVPAATAESQEA